MPFTQILKYFEAVSPGKVSQDQQSEIEGLLSDCWNYLSVDHHAGMVADKLGNRTEAMDWKPPILSFKIERHGGIVRGSTRAELLHWEIDLSRKVAGCVATGYRHLTASAIPLDVKPLVGEIALLISDGRDDARLSWRGATRVRVELAKIIPDTFPAQTTSGRRKRFRRSLNAFSPR